MTDDLTGHSRRMNVQVTHGFFEYLKALLRI